MIQDIVDSYNFKLKAGKIKFQSHERYTVISVSEILPKAISTQIRPDWLQLSNFS